MDPLRLDVRTRPVAFLTTLVVLLLTLALSSVASAASWSPQERIANDPPLAMTVDDRGHTHVVIDDGTGLRYSTDSSGTWRTKRINDFGSTKQPAIALSGGKVYVVFAFIGDCDAERGCTTDPSEGLYLATNRTGSWRTSRIRGTRPAYWPSLRMRDGKMHISYQDRTGIRYLTNTSGAWANTRVWSRRAGLTAAARTSITLGVDGRVHIAFMRTRSGVGAQGISVTTRTGGKWLASTVSSGADTLDRVVIRKAGWPLVGYISGAAPNRRFRLCEVIDGDVLACRTLPGKGKGSFTLDPSGRVELVRWSSGTLTWRAERASGWVSRSWPAPRISVAWIRSFGGVTAIVRDGFSSSAHAYSTWVLGRN